MLFFVLLWNLVKSHDLNHHFKLVNDVSIFLIVLILFWSIIFEILHHKLVHFFKHHNMKDFLELLNSLFREMALLGFVTLIFFVSTRFGFMLKLNDYLFGEDLVEKVAKIELKEETEPIEKAPTVILELFEHVHILIFFTMLIFIVVVIGLIYFGNKKVGQWRHYEAKSFSDLKSDINSNKSTEDNLEFWISRYRFLQPPNPFTPTSKFPQHFKFSDYLSDKLSYTLHNFVEIPFSTWIMIVLLAIAARPIMDSHLKLRAFFRIYSGVFVFVLALLVYLYCRSIKDKLLPCISDVQHYIETTPAKNGSITKVPEAYVDNIPFISEVKGLRKYFNNQTQIINPHDQLFVFGIKGTPHLQRVVQLILFLHVILIAAAFDPAAEKFLHPNTLRWGSKYLSAVIVILSLCTVWSLIIPHYSMVKKSFLFILVK